MAGEDSFDDSGSDWLTDYEPPTSSEILAKGTRALFNRKGLPQGPKGPAQIEADFSRATGVTLEGFIDTLSADDEEAAEYRGRIANTLNNIHTHKGPQIEPEEVPGVLASFFKPKK